MNALHQLFVWFNDPANWQGDNGVPRRVYELLTVWAWAMVIALLATVVVFVVMGGLALLGALS